MAVNWVDRVPTRANRVLVTPEDGGAAYYATITRADEPSVVGTPINAANLNAMQNAAGLTESKAIYVSTTGSDTAGTGAQSAPYATIRKALSTFPRNLNGYTAVIHIAAGTYAEAVNITGYGNGVLRFSGVAGDVVNISGLTISNVQFMEIENISISMPNGFLYIVGSNLRVFSTMSMSGGQYGMHATFFASVAFMETVTVSNTSSAAILATSCATVYVQSLQGSGNAVAVHSLRGSICSIGTNGSTATTLYQTGTGGRIYSGAQSQIPNY